ncbi:hypothetical protein B9Z34_03840 [Limnohabitans sp. Hippo3]|nr:hypothetical protein B9Z34_03840 [Limnohabitans sp. Hippo3]
MLLQPQTIALLFTVILLAVTAYFLLGSVPLLTLKHDNPMDSRFIRSFYLTYFRIAFCAAVVTALSYGFAGKPLFALGATAIGLLTLLLRHRLISKMDQLNEKIRANDTAAMAAFHKTHKSAIVINLVQLLAILYSLGSF